MIKLISLLIYNVMRLSVLKLIYHSRFNIHLIQRISPSASLTTSGKGKFNIGYNTEISKGCDFEVHGNGMLSIGKGTYFNRYCMISAHRSVTIGEYCMFGPGVKIFDNNHRFSKEQGVSSQLKCDDIYIGNRCWIASDAIILKGTYIGDNCVIGAGCIVSGNIPAGTLVKQRANLELIPMN